MEENKKNTLSEEQLKDVASGGVSYYDVDYQSIVRQFKAQGLRPPTPEEFIRMFPKKQFG